MAKDVPTPDDAKHGRDSGDADHAASISPMTAEQFARLWNHEVSDGERSWTPDMATYRNAFMYLMGMRRPHFAVVPLPTYLQPVMIATFLSGHHIYVGPTESGTRIRMTIWRPAHPGEDTTNLPGAPDA